MGGSGEATPGTEPGYRSDSRGGGDSEPDKRRKKPAKALKLRLDRVEGEDDDEAVFGDKGGPDIPDRPRERYSDIGGLEASLHDVMEHVEWPLAHPELYSHIGVSPPRGVLLHGPSGCGKTLLAHAIGGELGVYFRAVSGPEVISGMSGESERKLRSLFTDAMANAPAILFIDEIDCIAGKRSNSQRGMDKRVVSQLLACIDSLNLDSTADGQAVIVIGACNHPDDLDPSLRRPGRFDREICLGVPDDAARAAVLRVLTRRMKLPEGFDYDGLARMTPGFVGADLAALTKEAAVMAVNRVFKSLFASRPVVASDTAGSDAVPVIDTMSQWIRSSPPLTPEQLEGLIVTQEDFTVASKRVQPSALREGFATIPDVTWADVGALEDVRAELQLGVVDAIRRPEL